MPRLVVLAEQLLTAPLHSHLPSHHITSQHTHTYTQSEECLAEEPSTSSASASATTDTNNNNNNGSSSAASRALTTDGTPDRRKRTHTGPSVRNSGGYYKSPLRPWSMNDGESVLSDLSTENLRLTSTEELRIQLKTASLKTATVEQALKATKQQLEEAQVCWV